MRRWITVRSAAKIAGFGFVASIVLHIASIFGFDVMQHFVFVVPLMVGISLFWIPMFWRQEKGLEPRGDFLKSRLRKAPPQVKYGFYLVQFYVISTSIAFLY